MESRKSMNLKIFNKWRITATLFTRIYNRISDKKNSLYSCELFTFTKQNNNWQLYFTHDEREGIQQAPISRYFQFRRREMRQLVKYKQIHISVKYVTTYFSFLDVNRGYFQRILFDIVLVMIEQKIRILWFISC